MSLPSYVINWKELKNILQDLIDEHPLDDPNKIKGKQKVKGFAESIPALEAQYRVVEWLLEEDIMITGVTYSQSAWKAEDYWELWLDGDKLFDSVYTKELGDQKHWEILQLAEVGQTIKIINHNNSGNSKDIWADIEYIELDAKPPVIEPEPPEPEPEPEPPEPEEPEEEEPEIPEPEPEPEPIKTVKVSYSIHECNLGRNFAGFKVQNTDSGEWVMWKDSAFGHLGSRWNLNIHDRLPDGNYHYWLYVGTFDDPSSLVSDDSFLVSYDAVSHMGTPMISISLDRYLDAPIPDYLPEYCYDWGSNQPPQ